jgi:hypothetical protein
VIEVREGRRSPYRVRRLEGKLSASFRVKAAAELQDALWRRWGDQIPVLVDREPKIPSPLEARLLSPGRRELSAVLLAELLSAHPARDEARAPASNDGALLGEYIVDFFPKWAQGKVVLRGVSDKPKARKTIEIVHDGLHRIVFETQWQRDERGWRVRDAAGRLIGLGWGKTAAAWIPLRDFDMEHVLALAERVDDEEIGKEIWRKVRSFLKQLIDYAKLRNDYPRERANPVTLVPAPAQTGVRLVRRPYLPEIVEEIRADFLELEALVHAGVRRARGRAVETPAGVPVPPVAGFGQTSADLVEAIAYGGFRPGEILAVLGRHFAPVDLGEQYVHVCQRNVDGQIVPGTKSKRYPDKDVYLLGPLPVTMARRAAAAGLDDALFPYPGTNRLWTESDYRNWREDYFVPIARSHGLGSESDDPYALRHIYATLRIAAHHPTLYIESSMGTGLVGRVYGGVIRRYEGKGPLDVDREIRNARAAAAARRRFAADGSRLQLRRRRTIGSSKSTENTIL